MICPFCLHKKTTIYNSRSTTRLNATWRRRRCLSCQKEFTTREYIDPEKLFTVKSTTKAVPYQKTKLLLSIIKACDHLPNPDEAFWLCEAIEQKLIKAAATQQNVVTTDLIVRETLVTLKNFNTPAFVKYLTYHEPNLDSHNLKKRLKKN